MIRNLALVVALSAAVIADYGYSDHDDSNSYNSIHGGKGYGSHHGQRHGHDYYDPAYYGFEYGVHDPYYGANFGHKEQRDGHVTKGSYYVNLPDGRLQKVSYTADKYGYHPVITYEGHAKYPEPKSYKSHHGSHHGSHNGGYHK